MDCRKEGTRDLPGWDLCRQKENCENITNKNGMKKDTPRQHRDKELNSVVAKCVNIPKVKAKNHFPTSYQNF